MSIEPLIKNRTAVIEFSIEFIMSQFAKDFQSEDGSKIISREWYVDQAKDKVAFVINYQSKSE